VGLSPCSSSALYSIWYSHNGRKQSSEHTQSNLRCAAGGVLNFSRISMIHTLSPRAPQPYKQKVVRYRRHRGCARHRERVRAHLHRCGIVQALDGIACDSLEYSGRLHAVHPWRPTERGASAKGTQGTVQLAREDYEESEALSDFIAFFLSPSSTRSINTSCWTEDIPYNVDSRYALG